MGGFGGFGGEFLGFFWEFGGEAVEEPLELAMDESWKKMGFGKVFFENFLGILGTFWECFGNFGNVFWGI